MTNTPTDAADDVAPTPRTSRAALLLACVAVGAAIKVNGGNYHPAALALVAAAAVASLAGVLAVRVELVERLPPLWAATAAAAALAAQLAVTFAGRLVPTDTPGPTGPVYAALCGCAACLAPLVCWAAAGTAAPRPWPTVARVGFPIALALHLLAGTAAVGALPGNVFDFYVVQTLAGPHLLDGGNPYAMTFPDLSGGTSPHLDPSLMGGGQLLFGFIYPPLSLLCLLPVQFVGGDYRYATAAAFTAAGGLIGYCRPGPWPKLAAGLFLLTPTGMLIVAGGWSEPLVVLMLALTVFAACRRPAAAGWAVGLWWAVKQYVPLTAPLALLLAGRPTDRAKLLRLVAGAVLVGAVVTLPLALWDVKAFWHSTVAVQLRQPFRPDALSLPAMLYATAGVTAPAWVAFAGLAAAQALALWRAPRTPAGFAAATAFALLVFFALSKQAFANYYFLVTGALAAAAAAGSVVRCPSTQSSDTERTRGFEVVNPDRARTAPRVDRSRSTKQRKH